MRILWLKWRRYPIKRDKYGRSARQQAFDRFEEGHRPAQIYKQRMIPVPVKTLFRYYEDWKKQKHRLPYSTTRKLMKENSEFNEIVITKLAIGLEMSREEVVERIQRPWGLMQLMKGEWPDYRMARIQSEIEDRLEAALRLIMFAEKFGDKETRVVKGILERLILAKEKE